MNYSLMALVAVAMSMSLISCKNTDGTGAQFELADSNIAMSSIEKTYLDEATYEEVSPYVKSCQGNKYCVEICHRPPGNPDNSKTMLLPLKATVAHLHHGGNHEEKDYLGSCHDSEESDSSDDSSSEEVEDESGGEVGEEPTDEVPAWCETYYDVDQDCDGIRDSDGEPIF
jgi:hypothetical protein